jgi:hypothetical protein
MPTNGLNKTAVQILTWAVYALMALVSMATFYLIVEQSKMPDKYVRLERYQADTERAEATVCRLEAKFEVFEEKVDRKLDALLQYQRDAK